MPRKSQALTRENGGEEALAIRCGALTIIAANLSLDVHGSSKKGMNRCLLSSFGVTALPTTPNTFNGFTTITILQSRDQIESVWKL